MTDRINIHDHVAAICQQLDIEPAFCKELIITPKQVVATIFRKNEEGAKYLEPTSETLPSDDAESDVTGYNMTIAVETRTFEVFA